MVDPQPPDNELQPSDNASVTDGAPVDEDDPQLEHVEVLVPAENPPPPAIHVRQVLLLLNGKRQEAVSLSLLYQKCMGIKVNQSSTIHSPSRRDKS